jgi:hypothetical protein
LVLSGLVVSIQFVNASLMLSKTDFDKAQWKSHFESLSVTRLFCQKTNVKNLLLHQLARVNVSVGLKHDGVNTDR